MEKREICVAVAAHKPYRMPTDSAYLPIHVGAALHPDACSGFQPDNEGENISNLNASYSELTAMYWLWKNVDADIKGLVHYRRLLGSPNRACRKAKDPFDCLVTGAELEELLCGYDILLPKKRSYYIETVRDHYAHTHDAAHLDACREVLSEMCPEIVPAWDAHMAFRGLHICNMLITRADLFDSYCAWLFPVLCELTKRIDSSGMTSFEARWPGRVAELLLDPWIETRGLSCLELPVVSPEPVDWVAKGKGFLAAKFFGKKYEGSF